MAPGLSVLGLLVLGLLASALDALAAGAGCCAEVPPVVALRGVVEVFLPALFAVRGFLAAGVGLSPVSAGALRLVGTLAFLVLAALAGAFFLAGAFLALFALAVVAV